MNNLDIESNFVCLLSPSLGALTHMIEEHLKLNTEKINPELEKASEEIKEIKEIE